MKNSENDPMDPLTPEEAIEYLKNKQEEKTADSNGNGNGRVNGNGNGHVNGDRGAKEAQLLGSTKEAIALRKAEIEGEIKLRKAELKGEIDIIGARETAKEKAGKHLAVFGALYLCMMVLAFLGSVTFIPQDNLAIVATLITLVVTSLSGILKGISDTPEPKDPVELMHDIVQKQLQITSQSQELNSK
tara:strand:+ start:519 stop:1082 length:564 start_codon:yes stop_codon:yes gene_type:complete